MNPQFKIGYKCNLVFYFLEGLLIIFLSLWFKRIQIGVLIGFIVFFLCSFFAFSKYAKSSKLDTLLYGKLQSIAFIVLDCFLSTAFDSAQVFVYALFFGIILSFVFIDRRVSQFQMIVSTIVVLLVAVLVALYTGSQQTMLVYSFGVVLLLVTNWIVTNVAGQLNFQERKGYEQERSLDDMLKVVEAKCDEAQKATRSKTRFLANMSHEIRTPINSIMGMNEMIIRESNEEEMRKYAKETLIAAESLLGIINDILDITKIEAGKTSLTPVEYRLKPFINDIYNLIRFKAENKNLKFEIITDENLPSALIGDDIRLKQIVMNLLSNAVKYTHKGTVTLIISNGEEGKIRFTVKDTGIGIKEEDIERIFEAFARFEEKKNRSIEGTGLGLNITSGLLKLFDSELEVKSEYGKGSEFSFEIKQEIVDSKPLGKIDLKERGYDHEKYNAVFTAPDSRVLIVDDNEMNRKVFTYLLKATKIKVDEASSGMECLKMVAQTHYDIIFMDHMMPEMDGIQTLEEMNVQENNLCKNTPVIVLTANAVVGAKEFYIEAGFDDFLSKPIEPKKLEELIYSYLDKNGKKDNTEVKEAEVNAEPEKIIDFPIITGIDWNYARLSLKEDEALIKAIRMFLSSIKKDTDELNYYFDSIESESGKNDYRIKVHSMKSSASLIGIIQLAGMAMELENAIRDDRVDIVKAVHAAFIERWLCYGDLLKDFAETDNADKKDARSFREEILGIFEKIREAASAMDVDVLDEMSKKLDEYYFGEEAAKKIEQIKSDIFDFKIEKLTDCYYD